MAKVRTDFVSNSSSASFIVYSDGDKKSLSELAYEDIVLKMFKRINSVSFMPKTKFSDDLVQKAVSSGAFVLDDASGQLTFGKDATDNSIDLYLNQILKESSGIYCYFGLNDCDEYSVMLGQYGAMFEFFGYDINDSDSETPYSSIKDIL